jgi:hypothetical protein
MIHVYQRESEVWWYMCTKGIVRSLMIHVYQRESQKFDDTCVLSLWYTCIIKLLTLPLVHMYHQASDYPFGTHVSSNFWLSLWYTCIIKLLTPFGTHVSSNFWLSPRKAIFWSVTIYNKNLSSQCNLTAQTEPMQDTSFYLPM